MDEKPVKITKFYYDLTDPTSYAEIFEVTPSLIGKDLTPDETYQRYLELSEEGE